MADPDVQTPDMQTATGTPGPPELMSQGGLVDALRSRGTLPTSLMQSMMPMGGQAPNAGLAIGSGMLNAASGQNAALNPYLQQHQEQQNKQFWQQQQLQQRVDRQRNKQDELRNKIVEGLGRSDNPDAQKTYALEMAKDAKRLGLDVPPEQFAQSAKLSKEELDQINGDIVSNLPREQILARNPKLARMHPQWLDSQVQMAQNPAWRKKNNWATDDEMKIERAEREQKTTELELKGWKSKNLDVSDKQLPYVAKFVLEKTGLPLMGLDAANPDHQRVKAAAIVAADAELKAKDVAWATHDESKRVHEETRRSAQVREAETERHNRNTEAATLRGQDLTATRAAAKAATDKPMSPARVKMISSVVDLDGAIQRVDHISSSPEIKNIVNKYIGPYASRWIEAQRVDPTGLAGKTPQEVIDLQQSIAVLKNAAIQLRTGATVGQGQETIRLLEELVEMKVQPDVFWRKYETAKIGVMRQKKVIEALVIKGDPRAIELMRELDLTPAVQPDSVPGQASPGTVLNPSTPGARREGNILVSESGKFVSRDGGRTWQNK